MKIYFTAAINALNDHGDNYKKIVEILESMGHEVISNHILNTDLKTINSQTQEDIEKYYVKMQTNLKNSDILVSEVSFPSTVHVGHELTLALEKDKPALALYLKGKKPVLLWGITSDKFHVSEYDEKTLKHVLKESVKYLSEQMDSRFNFFVSPKIVNYLDWIAKKKRLPRAVYLRKLIEKDMEKDEEKN